MSRHLVLPAVAGILIVAGGVLLFLGSPATGSVLLLLALAVLVAGEVTRRRAHRPVGEVDPGVREAIRARRDAEGPVAAVRELRRHRPDTSLVDAKRWVDGL